MLVKALLLAGAAISVLAAPAGPLIGRELPTPVSAATARTYLSQLQLPTIRQKPIQALDHEWVDSFFKYYSPVNRKLQLPGDATPERVTVLVRDGSE
ncbi:hypothetical protein V5O48_013398 [Marasmius crinis-equi]|uniref:Uncharacterized protein n=1 Tax=Marasmius crinis-equi TaxID=585013 RepID=A0ABR3F0B9_9AGAR